MNWIDVSEQDPPKDRLILVSTGIAWCREDEHKDPVFSERQKREIIPARHYKKRQKLGFVALVY